MAAIDFKVPTPILGKRNTSIKLIEEEEDRLPPDWVERERELPGYYSDEIELE